MGLLGGFGMFSGGSGGGGGGIVESIVAGRNITVDDTDPANPIVATTADDITVVANYSALPSAGSASGDFYWCSASQGTAWLPGALGGTYYSAGLYYSNGVSWEFLSVPYQATQATVNTGTNDDQFVTPKTFTNASKWDTKKSIATGNNYKFVTTGATGDIQETTVTASRAVATDANGLPTASTTTATELGYVNGVTSAIQTQIDGKSKNALLFGTITVFSPADSTTTYVGFFTNQAVNTTASNRQLQGTGEYAYAIQVMVDPTGGNGSSENVTIDLYNVTDATAVSGATIDLAFDQRGKSAIATFSSPVLLSTSKYYSIRLTFPAWATNPTSVEFLGSLLIK